MTFITPSIIFVFLTVALCFLFLYQALSASRAVSLALSQGERGDAPTARLSFAGKRHAMEKKDRLPVLLITLVYALTAFFQLGDLTAPTNFVNFKDRPAVTISLHGTKGSDGPAVYSTGIRYYPGLGTGSYNVEVSSDGENWSTLWRRHDDQSDKNKVTGYYWADAAGYTPDYALTQNYNQLFKWIDIEVENPQNIQYLRISGKADKEVLELGRLCLLGQDGQVLPICYGFMGFSDFGDIDPELYSLFDWENVPEKSTWHTSTYFDEIYHARTAKEHIDGVYPYEITHPPMGKLILSLGIRAFGMTPFGWRCMGVLFGVLMLPILYVFLKNMFGKTVVSVCGTILFAADFMHLTQTRIATIDTYAVFFILAMYFFMYRYLTLPAGTSFRKQALPLLLSGLMWGFGAASKWTVFYAGIGLAVVYFIGFYQRLRDWPEEEKFERTSWIVKTLLFSVLCFIILPAVIYFLAYLPYAWANGADLSLKATLRGFKEGFPLLFQNLWGKLTYSGEGSFQAAYIPGDTLPGIVAGNQWYMFNYHQGVTQSHPYSSWWFQWVVDARPILYYMDNDVSGYTTRFAAFSNPVVCWAGLGAILICFAGVFRRFWAKLGFLWGFGAFAALTVVQVQKTPNGVFDPALSPEVLARNKLILLLCLLLYLASTYLIARATGNRSTHQELFITVAFLSQLVPWFFIGRTTFEYHYFPSILFLVFAIAALFDALVEKGKDWQFPVCGMTGISVGLYALFYPILIGLQIPVWYEPMVKWLESWPF